MYANAVQMTASFPNDIFVRFVTQAYDEYMFQNGMYIIVCFSMHPQFVHQTKINTNLADKKHDAYAKLESFTTDHKGARVC